MYKQLPNSTGFHPKRASIKLSSRSQNFELEDLSLLPHAKDSPFPSGQTYAPLSLWDSRLEDDILNSQKTSKNPFWNSDNKSWRYGARLAALAASITLLINVTAAIWTVRHYGSGLIVEIFRGDCRKVEKMSTWIHLLINALSTALLSGSNYCMQCLSAPNRNEVDMAHEKRKWLDIGVPSVRNLGSISWKKIALWLILAFTSIPLHLMYNSAFFSSIATNDYNIIYAIEDFVNNATLYSNETSPSKIPGTFEPIDWSPARAQQNVSSYERLENRECIQSYGTDFITDRRTLVIITDNNSTSKTGSLVRKDSYDFVPPENLYDPYPWICQDSQGFAQYQDTVQSFAYCYQYLPQMISDASAWEPNGIKSNYCLSERISGTCGFNVNLAIISTVIICNMGKLIVMLYVSAGPLSDPLITVGDAISSYLSRPDTSSSGMCIATKQDVVSTRHKEKWVENLPKLWQPQRRRWFSAASKKRWLTCLALFITALVAIALLLSYAELSLGTGQSLKSLYRFGLGQVHGQTLITGWSLDNFSSKNSQITVAVLIANLPQTILSFLYLTLNGLLTSMFLAAEWNDFAQERKGLRVSSPSGAQRSSYFLQLPYRVAIPLLILSGLLHWLVSQSIFLGVVAQYDPVGKLKNGVAVATCGYSPFAMVLVMIVGSLIVVGCISLGFRRFKPGMPLVGSCSAAIASACHSYEPGVAFQPVQWGVISDDKTTSGVGHCTFSAQEVKPPVPGHAYAGTLRQIIA